MAVEGPQMALDLRVAGDLIGIGNPGILTSFAVVIVASQLDQSAEFYARLLGWNEEVGSIPDPDSPGRLERRGGERCAQARLGDQRVVERRFFDHELLAID